MIRLSNSLAVDPETISFCRLIKTVFMVTEGEGRWMIQLGTVSGQQFTIDIPADVDPHRAYDDVFRALSSRSSVTGADRLP